MCISALLASEKVDNLERSEVIVIQLFLSLDCRELTLLNTSIDSSKCTLRGKVYVLINGFTLGTRRSSWSDYRG